MYCIEFLGHMHDIFHQVIKLLMAQKARYEFLTMTYDIEARFHREIHHLLTTLLQTMADKRDGFYKRMVGS